MLARAAEAVVCSSPHQPGLSAATHPAHSASGCLVCRSCWGSVHSLHQPGLLTLLLFCLVQELLGQCGHYSERVRKDALQGLGQLLAAHPGACSRRHMVGSASSHACEDEQPGVEGAARGRGCVQPWSQRNVAAKRPRDLHAAVKPLCPN